MKKASTFFVIVTLLRAWYPDYSVMVTDYVLPQRYLAPMKIHSIGLQALGVEFNGLYNHPLDNAFRNPAYLGLNNGQYFYLDLAGDQSEPAAEDEVYARPGIYHDLAYSSPYYWSPYREQAPAEVQEPLGRLVYLGRPMKLFPLRLGLTAEYFFARQEFYQPYWYSWGWREYDANGAAYDQELVDPYEDYRLVESGENNQDEQGFRISSFIAMPLFSFLSTGMRLTIDRREIDGDYRDFNNYDDSPWRDEYLRYNSVVKTRDQVFEQYDLSVGVMINSGGNSRLGATVGRITGNIDRRLAESDSSYYYSRYFHHPDTNRSNTYRSSSGYSSNKDWIYDGHGNYGMIHGDWQVTEAAQIRWGLHFEDRQADLNESESMWRRSRHHSIYWYNDISDYRENDSHSRMQIERTGSGIYRAKNYRINLGVDWWLSPKVRFVGGLALMTDTDKRRAEEPFLGEKYTFYRREWNNNSEVEYLQTDDKSFSWRRDKRVNQASLPTGVIVKAGESVELTLGLTKIIRTVDIEEGYDLVVYHETNTHRIDGTTITSSDSAYVDGYQFPDINLLDNYYELNAGISFKYRERFRITAAFHESILEPRFFKIGAEFKW